MTARTVCFIVILFKAMAFATAPSVQLPCDFSGDVLRGNDGKIAQYSSAQMKKRAVHKADVSESFKQVDIKGTAIVDVLVDPSGKVLCVKTLYGHDIIRVEVEKALLAWRFRPAEVKGKPVAYVGRLEFAFCNISCGKEGPSMTLLK